MIIFIFRPSFENAFGGYRSWEKHDKTVDESKRRAYGGEEQKQERDSCLGVRWSDRCLDSVVYHYSHVVGGRSNKPVVDAVDEKIRGQWEAVSQGLCEYDPDEKDHRSKEKYARSNGLLDQSFHESGKRQNPLRLE